MLEWAQDDDSVEVLRKKTADYFHERILLSNTTTGRPPERFIHTEKVVLKVVLVFILYDVLVALICTSCENKCCGSYCSYKPRLHYTQFIGTARLIINVVIMLNH